MRKVARIARLALPVLLLFGEESIRAEEAQWTVLLEPMYMDVYGHDTHVLTIRQSNLDSTPTQIDETPVALQTEDRIGFRFELQYTRSDWGMGLDFFWFNTSQGRPTRTAAASGPGGPEQVAFETSDRTFTSDDPGEVLFFNVLEDTDIATWTVDLYGLKTLTETPAGSWQLQFGLRNADFDNDYHHAVGIQDVGGTLVDASSNYGRMMGPVIGVVTDVRFGKHSIRAYLGQSVVLGSAELLLHETSDFVGPFGTTPTITAQESFNRDEDVAIPITEFRINWLYPISQRIAVGVSANTSVWWNVPVPPGVIPGASDTFHEDTLVYFGLAVAVKLKI
jgi:hypothetical protein